MLQIKYNDIFLDIAGGDDAEMERKSPLFSLEEYMAEYSTPIKFFNTEKNAAAFGYYFFEHTVRAKQNFSVEVYDQNGYRFAANLVLESAGMYTDQTRGYASGYLLTNVSDFFTAVKDKKLTDLKLGGDRNFIFTSFDPTDGTDGYWQHFHDTWNFTEDYIMLPCRNDTWFGEESIDLPIMNMIGADGHILPYCPVVPFVKVEYVLNQIFQESGWTIDTTGLNDDDWKKLVLFNAKAIILIKDIFYRRRTFVPQLPPDWETTIGDYALDAISFKLADFMPADYKCTEWITAICTRYAWVPLFNSETKSCRLVALKDVDKGPVKDFTAFAAPLSESQIGDDRTFSFKNTFEGEDSFPSNPDLSSYPFKLTVDNKYSLPAADSGYDNSIFYSFRENQWYRIAYDDATNTRFWEPFADNIYDVESTESTVNFDTKCTTLPVYYTFFRTNITSRYLLIPTCAQSQYKKFGIRTIMYLGDAIELRPDGTNGTVHYPFSSSVNVMPDGTIAALWSNVFEHKTGSDEYGIIKYWFERWLNVIKNSEEITRRLYLPFHQLLTLSFDNVILINSIPYLIKSYTEPLPYKGFINAILVRLSLETGQSITPALIYIHTEWENISARPDPDPRSWLSANDADLVLYCWADAAGTVPVDPVALSIYYKYYNARGGYQGITTALINAHRTVLGRYLKDGINLDSVHIELDYALQTSTNYEII